MGRQNCQRGASRVREHITRGSKNSAWSRNVREKVAWEVRMLLFLCNLVNGLVKFRVELWMNLDIRGKGI